MSSDLQVFLEVLSEHPPREAYCGKSVREVAEILARSLERSCELKTMATLWAAELRAGDADAHLAKWLGHTSFPTSLQHRQN
jgi:hypothetical protein